MQVLCLFSYDCYLDKNVRRDMKLGENMGTFSQIGTYVHDASFKKYSPPLIVYITNTVIDGFATEISRNNV